MNLEGVRSWGRSRLKKRGLDCTGPLSSDRKSLGIRILLVILKPKKIRYQ